MPVLQQVPSGEQAEIDALKKTRKDFFISLYMPFKIDFFAEKYLSITEDIYDIESTLVIRSSLLKIWY